MALPPFVRHESRGVSRLLGTLSTRSRGPGPRPRTLAAAEHRENELRAQQRTGHHHRTRTPTSTRGRRQVDLSWILDAGSGDQRRERNVPGDLNWQSFQSKPDLLGRCRVRHRPRLDTRQEFDLLIGQALSNRRIECARLGIDPLKTLPSAQSPPVLWMWACAKSAYRDVGHPNNITHGSALVHRGYPLCGLELGQVCPRATPGAHQVGLLGEAWRSDDAQQLPSRLVLPSTFRSWAAVPLQVLR